MRSRITSVGLFCLPDPALDFEYPTHIDRASLDALPGKPGVYVFRDRWGEPVYIGKSVNIRSRVLSHLRTPQESAMLQTTSRVEFLRTAGEIGALLLESQLIKQLQPVWNVLLRVTGEWFALRLDDGGSQPEAVGIGEAGATEPEAGNLYGMFTSRVAAVEGLRALLRGHGLCPALAGLESTVHGRACFSHQTGRCRGACIGLESAVSHAQRLRAALCQLQGSAWPHDGPVGIVESDGKFRQIHIVDRWSYLGSLSGRRRQIRRPSRCYPDIDTYKILLRPMTNGSLDLVPCRVHGNAVRCGYFD